MQRVVPEIPIHCYAQQSLIYNGCFYFSYYEYIWQRNKGVSFGSLFQGMPISLQADISLSLYKKIIDQVNNPCSGYSVLTVAGSSQLVPSHCWFHNLLLPPLFTGATVPEHGDWLHKAACTLHKTHPVPQQGVCCQKGRHWSRGEVYTIPHTTIANTIRQQDATIS